jgi:hypothetical protein
MLHCCCRPAAIAAKRCAALSLLQLRCCLLAAIAAQHCAALPLLQPYCGRRMVLFCR